MIKDEDLELTFQPETTATHLPESPEFIYQLIQTKISSNSTLDTPLEDINKNSPDLSLTLDGDFANIEESIFSKIKQIRSQNFTYRYASANKKEVLIKDLTNTPESAFNPMHPREAEIQALRYLHGFLLILENTFLVSQKTRDSFKHKFDLYTKKMTSSPQDASAHTHWLAESFAKLLVNDDIDIDHARKQITMARDLSILLETHPAICTISKNDGTITIEKTSQFKVCEAFYDKHFSTIKSQRWFRSALVSAGFSASDDDTWLENFFQVNLEDLKVSGTPATSSSRWLPLPANTQLIENHVINQLTHQHSSTSFVRTGTLAAYEIPDTATQETLAIDQLKEIIKNQLLAKIKHFKIKYSEIIPAEKLVKFDFYVNYQSLLTTHYIESALPHTDNNSRFYKLTKNTMAIIANDNELKTLAAEQGANLIFYHTNFSINKYADWISARKYSQRMIDIQHAKIAAIEKMAENIDNSKWNATTDEKIHSEMTMRMTASAYMKSMLLSNDAPSPLKHYQRHIMMAALEFLTMGDQALTLAGCKSARDRTLIFAAAVKTMQENPTAMYDWDALSAGIIKSIMQGHHFRSISHHVAVGKINLVHAEFMTRLPPILQADISATKIFTDTLHEYVPRLKESNNANATFFSRKIKNINVTLPQPISPRP